MDMKHLSSVYFLSGCRAGTTFEYRVLQKQEQLALYGISSIAQQNLSYREGTLKEALSSDLLYLYRVAYSPFVERLIQQARARHIPVVFDIDDLIFDPELSHQVDPLKAMSHEQIALYYEGVWRFRQTLLASDYIVTSTEYLANLLREHGKPVFVHRNGLSQDMIDKAETLIKRRYEQPKRDTVVIGYGSGTATHRQDFAEAADALHEIMDRHPDVELHIVGPLHPDDPLALPDTLKAFEGRIKHLPLVKWEKWLTVLNTFDINISPLESSNPFCLAKSEIKYTEAALLAIPTVASRTKAFEHAVCENQTGYLATNTKEWINALDRMVINPALRQRLGEAARTDVLERYAPKILGQKLVRSLEKIQEMHTQKKISRLESAPDPRTVPLILDWIVTEPTPGSGGHTDIVRMTNLLASFGHQVNMYIVPRQQLADKSDLEIREYLRQHFAKIDGSVFKWTDAPLVESDALILTHWTTAYEVEDFQNASKIFYFVQDWEPFFSPMGTDYLRAEQTYKMGFSCITLGRWLTEHLRSRYDADADYFDLAVDHEIYHPRPVEKPKELQICFYARPWTPRRLFPIGVETLQLVHERRPDVRIVFYGADDGILNRYQIPFPYTNLGILTEEELSEVFSASDVGIVFSSTNCSLVPPEMMACKCAVVDLNRETVRGVLEHEANALLAEPTPEAIADAVVRLLDDTKLREQLIETAYQQIQKRSWRKSARKVEEILYEKIPTRRQARALHRFEIPPSPPALIDLPSKQQTSLDAIHGKRRRLTARLKAIAKKWTTRLLRAGQNLGLNGAPIRKIGEITGRRCVGQSFVAQRDDLHRIDVLMSTQGRRNTRDVIFHLRESPTAREDLAQVRINASLLSNDSYARFVFEPQSASRGKTFYFCIESPESVPGDAIALWAYRQVDLPNTTLCHNGRVMDGQLIFGTFYLDDQIGEVGERPDSRGVELMPTFWHRLRKGYRLLSTHNLSALLREVSDFLIWKADTM
jgi:glycosyltransferase involved in cell wall biosynthesis